jgi:hypothetical protein
MAKKKGKAVPDCLRDNEPLIDDSTPEEDTHDVKVDGEEKGRGLIPRDWDKFPLGCYGGVRSYKAVDMPVIPKSEWSDRIKEMETKKSRLSDIILKGNKGSHIPSLDQNGQGYCWAYSSTGCVMALRAAMNLPYVRLSAHGVACVIKGFQDEGGWGAQSLDFIMNRGVPSVEFWAEKSMSKKYDTKETWENAALHKVTGGWIDLADAQYDRNLTFDQVATLLLCRIPIVVDFNWWGHSVHATDLVEVSRVDYGIRIRNSWTDSYGDRGFAVLQGNKARPDGATAPYATIVSAT